MNREADGDGGGGDSGGSPWGAVAGLVVVVLIVVAVLLIMNHLRQASEIQDCVAAGRRNCAPIDAPARP